ncbi:MAG TPA: mannose-1-phosphate guanylyltransferase [Candidatus Saccharimonadales bacterium]|nr:mannose-1-phosphate guanylyltransferase [Candidatus Saccharimonadales bacterium]
MIIAIIAGGSGTRLWPLSTPDYPKHLLKVNNSERSLLQHTYDRAKELGDQIYIISEAGHIDHVKEQLPDIADDHFVVEPARRGTSSCIMAALVYIEKRHGDDEPVAFMPADHYIRDTVGFTHSFKLAEDVSKSEQRLVLVGVEPDHPATGLGYIQKGDVLSEDIFVYNVHSFKEKPDYKTAKKYVDSGNYLWNAGYFVGSPGTFKRSMKEYAPDMSSSYEKLTAASGDAYNELYLGLESISIDYALMEKVRNLLVVPASFDWMDLGSFSELHKAIGGDHEGNHRHGPVETDEVSNSFLHNQEDKPVAVIGLDNVVVINTPDGILVARKDHAQKVGDISKRLKK